jgi:membrane fusion protein (multidrug efflux system)
MTPSKPEHSHPDHTLPWWRQPMAVKAGWAGLAACVLLLAYYMIFHFPYVTTDDARVAATLIRLAPEPPAAGRILAINAAEGDTVTAGSVLLELDHRAADAQLQRATAQATLAQSNLGRVERLAKSHGVPERDVVIARANADSAAADLRLAQLALEHTTLKSPVDSVVVQKTAEVGNLLEPGQVAMVLADVEHAWISANVEETEAGLLKPGQKVYVSVDEGGSLTGRLLEVTAATAATFALIPSENPSGNYTKLVQRIPVKIILDPHPRVRLRAGQSVLVRIKVHG